MKKIILFPLVLFLSACSGGGSGGGEKPGGNQVLPVTSSALVGKTYQMHSQSSSDPYNYQVYVQDGKQVKVSQFSANRSGIPLETVTVDYTLVNNVLSYNANFSITATSVNMAVSISSLGEVISWTVNAGGVPSNAGATPTAPVTSGDSSGSSLNCSIALATESEIRIVIQGFNDGEGGTTKPEVVSALKAGCLRSTTEPILFMEGFLCDIKADTSFKTDIDVQEDVHKLVDYFDGSDLSVSCAEIQNL